MLRENAENETGKNGEKTGEIIMSIRFSKKEMQSAAKKIQNYVKKNKKQPSSITMVDMNGKSRKLTKKQ